MAQEGTKYARRRRRESSEQQDDDRDSMTRASTSPAPSSIADLDAEIVKSQPPPQKPSLPRRQSSFAQPRPDGTPRTAHRVRFEIQEPALVNGGANTNDGPKWADEDDGYPVDERYGMNGHGSGQRLPLLTGLEAPSIALAGDGDEFSAEDHLESARPRSGMNSAFMNMANSIIGAGIIGQPYAFRQAGLMTGIILLVVLTITVDWTIRLIVVNSKLSGANSFQATMEHCFGKPGLIAISVAQWAFAFGGMLAFCIIVGDTIPHVMVYLFPSLPDMHFLWILTDRRAVIVLTILGVSFPLSLYRDIAKLAKASTLALISMIVIILTVIIEGAKTPAEQRGSIRASLFIEPGIFQAVGVISFAFVCHHNSLLIYGSLKKPTIDRFAKVTHYSTGISMLACMAMALAGFLTFGDLTQGNVLNNFPTNNLMVNIARLCFGLNMLTTLPLECFVCREVMENYFFPGEHYNAQRHMLFTTSLVVSAMSLSLVTCDLGAVFELIGATSACALAYILPPLCYMKLSSRSWRIMVPSIACVVFGSVVMVISVVQAIIKIARNEGGTATCG